MRPRTRLAIVVGVGVLMGGAFVSMATASVATNAAVPSLSQTDLAAFAITVDNPTSAATVSSQTAARTAAAFLGIDQQALEILHVSATMAVGEPGDSSWVVIFAGGPTPPGGPPGTEATPVVEYTGVVVSDQTGEVLRYFTRSHD